LNPGIFQPFTWEEGIIVDNAISTTNQSNTSTTTHQRTGSVRADQVATSAAVGGDGLSKNSGVGAVSDHHPHSSPTPPLQRRLAKSFSVAPSQTKGSYHIFIFV
jgi:hypothetical protein